MCGAACACYQKDRIDREKGAWVAILVDAPKYTGMLWTALSWKTLAGQSRAELLKKGKSAAQPKARKHIALCGPKETN